MKTVDTLVVARTDQLSVGGLASGPLAWLEEIIAKFSELKLCWLLAHAEDEVVWGRVENGKLLLSRPGDLRPATLLECRLFSQAGELLVWRADGAWEARLVKEDSNDKAVKWIDEYQILWGSRVDSTATHVPEGFTPLIEVEQNGMRHRVPCAVSDADLANARLRLQVRHYLDNDRDNGETSIVLSRLVKVGIFSDKDLVEVPQWQN